MKGGAPPSDKIVDSHFFFKYLESYGDHIFYIFKNIRIHGEKNNLELFFFLNPLKFNQDLSVCMANKAFVKLFSKYIFVEQISRIRFCNSKTEFVIPSNIARKTFFMNKHIY